jgi:hypothetical protein
MMIRSHKRRRLIRPHRDQTTPLQKTCQQQRTTSLLLLLLTRKNEPAMMNRRASPSHQAVSFSKLSTSEQEYEDGVIRVVAECVPTVAEHEPSSSILPQQEANILEQGRLTWTDQFFAQQDDIVAVFDYDPKIMEEIMASEKFGGAKILSTLSFMGAMFLCALTEAPIVVYVLCVGLLIFACVGICRAEETMVVDSWAHTAVTQTGMRHVQTRRTDKDWGLTGAAAAAAFALDIPFEDIISITRMGIFAPHSVLLTLASTDGDGLKFITSGDYYFQKERASPSQVSLVLTNLKEPVLLMKVLRAMKDKKSVVPRKSSSSKAADLLYRVETVLDNGSSDHHFSGPNVEQSLRELVVELRELNTSIKSSGIEQHDVATMV